MHVFKGGVTSVQNVTIVPTPPSTNKKISYCKLLLNFLQKALVKKLGLLYFGVQTNQSTTKPMHHTRYLESVSLNHIQ
jgi:hypothetical protein